MGVRGAPAHLWGWCFVIADWGESLQMGRGGGWVVKGITYGWWEDAGCEVAQISILEFARRLALILVRGAYAR